MSSLDTAERAVRGVGGLVAAAALVAAVGGISRARRRSAVHSERPVARFEATLVVETAAFIGLGGLLWRELPLRLGPGARVVTLSAGGAALVSGLGLYLAGMAALGPAYDASSTFRARLHPDQRLVTSGPYALIRHPMYVGLALAAIGALLLYRTWTTLAFVAMLPVLVARARREEESLAERFGARWDSYRRRVPAWIPDLGETDP
jgi:protein-S-isoprenylcysteine O-methyltransferase Ste14